MPNVNVRAGVYAYPAFPLNPSWGFRPFRAANIHKFSPLRVKRKLLKLIFSIKCLGIE